MSLPVLLDPDTIFFPPTQLAMEDPDGLLAVGGDLTPDWILEAYRNGIFPWFNPGEPILWWTPNPRSILRIDNIQLRKSLIKKIRQYARQRNLVIKFDTQFAEVMKACALTPREGQNGTWITQEMLNVYSELNQMGYAHSVEVYLDGDLQGGLYGIQIGKMFFGESMFSWQADTSKIALAFLSKFLKKNGFKMIDTQIETPHLNSMGAELIAREQFEMEILELTHQTFPAKRWAFDESLLTEIL